MKTERDVSGKGRKTELEGTDFPPYVQVHSIFLNNVYPEKPHRFPSDPHPTFLEV